MSVSICVYWGPRQRPLTELVSQATAYFHVLGEANEGLSRWAPMGRSLKQATLSEPVDTSSPEILRRFLLKGQNKTDMPPRQPIPELGYSCHFGTSAMGIWKHRPRCIVVPIRNICPKIARTMPCSISAFRTKKGLQLLFSWMCSGKPSTYGNLPGGRSGDISMAGIPLARLGIRAISNTPSTSRKVDWGQPVEASDSNKC